MPNLSPIFRFWLGVAISSAIGVTQGTLVLTNAVPDGWIKAAIAWAGIIAFVGSLIRNATDATALTASSRVASAAAVVGVKRIDVTPDVAAQVTDATRQDANIVTVNK
jgi:hypothetical protein